MRLKESDNKTATLLYLLPVPLFCIVLVISGHAWWEYLRGDEEEAFWVIASSVITIYFGVRAWLGISHTIEWGDDQS